MEIEYTKEELMNVIENVRAVEGSDDLPIYTWARAAKVLEAVADSRKELLREIKVMNGYCPFCWANFKEPCASGCKMGKELGDD